MTESMNQTGEDRPGASDARVRKAALRDVVRTRLAALSGEDVQRSSAAVCRRLVQADFFQRASTVMLYLPVGSEVDLTCLALRCFQDGKTVCAPRLDWQARHMTAVEIRGLDDRFEQRHHGVREPVGSPLPVDEIDLILVPGLGFDASGRRLGRGGGFYDRFLSHPLTRERGARVCGVCHDIQIVDAVPSEPHDVVMDVVVTDRRMICAPCARRG